MSTRTASVHLSAAGRRRVMGALFVSRGAIAVAYLAGFTVLSIVGERLSGQVALAGIPPALIMVGRAIGPLPISRAMDALGRRPAIAGAYTVGAGGAVIAAASIAAGSYPWLLVGAVLLGVARAAADLSRYAAAEIYPAEQRGRAIGLIVFAAVAGSVGGPLLVIAATDRAAQAGLEENSGPWFAAAMILAFAALVVWLFVRPDPRDAAVSDERPAQTAQTAQTADAPLDLRGVLTMRTVQVGVLAMIVSQAVMTTIMVVAPLHLHINAHEVGVVSLAMTVHVTGMFALAPLTGRLVDGLGPRPVILGGAVLLVAASVLATLDAGLGTMMPALFLLGYGWNACFVAGSTLLARGVPAGIRARLQGRVETLTAVVGALSGAASGPLLAVGGGMGWVGVAGLAAALVLLAALRWR